MSGSRRFEAKEKNVPIHLNIFHHISDYQNFSLFCFFVALFISFFFGIFYRIHKFNVGDVAVLELVGEEGDVLLL